MRLRGRVPSLLPIATRARQLGGRRLLIAPRNACAILEAMRSRASRLTATLVLLTCFICPLLETFDSWDHTLQTGNDTEYTLVLLALCVGVAYSFARFIFKSALLGLVAKRIFACCAQQPSRSTSCSFAPVVFEEISPPNLPLRI
jgi:hypothetical protein